MRGIAMINYLIDGLFVFGLIMFQLATIRQLRKVLHTHQTIGISLTHYKWKLMALVSMSAGYGASCLYSSPLYLSLVVSILELTLNIALFYYVYKFRMMEWEQDRHAKN